nr:hypothetical protein [Tanacetum cinerariifolium]
MLLLMVFRLKVYLLLVLSRKERGQFRENVQEEFEFRECAFRLTLDVKKTCSTFVQPPNAVTRQEFPDGCLLNQGMGAEDAGSNNIQINFLKFLAAIAHSSSSLSDVEVSSSLDSFLAFKAM